MGRLASCQIMPSTRKEKEAEAVEEGRKHQQEGLSEVSIFTEQETQTWGYGTRTESHATKNATMLVEAAI
ncbi:hypothetical protein F442_20863 [Phytophthora nicotianae P10297]|uniref:Uncharacterized protein n=1 Tax=Phytophthora nicotianae P10297 TaxID=1317064 RepID=W2Y4Y2_PHYNI|nr:hypothetical protein F442_20863 [Phytophthora nicotianae P10297]